MQVTLALSNRSSRFQDAEEKHSVHDWTKEIINNNQQHTTSITLGSHSDKCVRFKNIFQSPRPFSDILYNEA